MKKYFIIFLVLVAILLTTYYYIIPENRPETVRIGVLAPIIPSLPHWIAMKNGYYDDEGIQVLEYSQNSSSNLVNSLLAGDIDYLTGVSTVDVINAFANKSNPLKAKIISHAQIRKNDPFEGLIVPRGSKIVTLKDLESSRIAVYPGITAEATLKVFLKSKGLDIETITFHKIPPPLHLEALRSGDVDCAFTYEPMRTYCLEGEKTREIFSSIYASFSDPCAIGVTVLSNKILEEKPIVAKKILKVWNRSIDYISSNPEESKKILKDKLRLNDYTAENSSWVYLTRTSEIAPDVLHNTVSAYQQIGVINPDFVLNSNFILSDD